jgi:hypothetical protein
LCFGGHSILPGLDDRPPPFPFDAEKAALRIAELPAGRWSSVFHQKSAKVLVQIPIGSEVLPWISILASYVMTFRSRRTPLFMRV